MIIDNNRYFKIMKYFKFLQRVVILAVTLLLSVSSFAQFDGPPPGGRPPMGQGGPGGARFKQMMSRTVLENIANRKSVRNFVATDPVTKDTLEMLVKAGMAAPTAMNKQPWHFFATNDAKIIEAAAAKLGRGGNMIAEAGAVIIILGEPTVSEMFWAIDCSCAAENILLAIEALGLGGVWLSAYPNEQRMNDINEAFGIPAEYKVLCMIPVGHPTGKDKPKDKWNKKKFHFNKW